VAPTHYWLLFANRLMLTQRSLIFIFFDRFLIPTGLHARFFDIDLAGKKEMK